MRASGHFIQISIHYFYCSGLEDERTNSSTKDLRSRRLCHQLTVDILFLIVICIEFEAVEMMKLKQITVKNILHIMSFAVCGVFCYLQCHKVLRLYFEYPIYTIISDFQTSNLAFPGITICSSIAIRKSMLLALEQGEDLMNASASSELQIQLDRYYHQYLEEHPMEKLIVDTLNFDDVASPEKITCLADTLHRSNYCKQLQAHTINSSENLRSCFTLFHGSEANPLQDDPKFVPSASVSHSRIIINNETLTATRENAPLNRGEIMRFIVSMNHNESTSLHLPVTGDLRVHENLRIPAYIDTTTEFQSGEYLQSVISFGRFTLLEAPYRTNCRTYYSGLDRDANPLFGHIISHLDCIHSCVTKTTIKRCKCWPPEIPFIRDRQGNATRNLFLCDWMKMAKKKLNETIDTSNTGDLIHKEKKLQRMALKIFSGCTGSWVTYCEKKCGIACRFAFVETENEIDRWPSKQRTSISAEDRELNKCCALISIQYNQIQRNFVYTPKYDFVSTMSNVFGIVSLWLGFILLDVVKYVIFTLKSAWEKFR